MTNTLDGDYKCVGLKLTSLEGCPSKVNGNFVCSFNRLTSLIGVDDLISEINGYFDCTYNPITEGGLGLLLIDNVTQLIRANSIAPASTNPNCQAILNLHAALTIINDHLQFFRTHRLDRGESIYECQNALIKVEDGFERYAIL